MVLLVAATQRRNRRRRRGREALILASAILHETENTVCEIEIEIEREGFLRDEGKSVMRENEEK